MAIADVITLLEASPAFSNVQEARPGGFDIPVNSGKEITFRLQDTAEVYALTAGPKPKFPHVVHQLLGVDNLDIEGFRILQIDRYLLSIRDQDFDDLTKLTAEAIVCLDGSEFSFQTNDLAYDFEPLKELNRADMAIEVAYPAISPAGFDLASSLPVAFVWFRGRDAEELEDSYEGTQRVNNDYSIVLVTNNGDLETLRNATQVALLGKQVQDTYHDLSYVSGRHVAAVGDMEIWQEVYTDWNQIKEI